MELIGDEMIHTERNECFVVNPQADRVPSCGPVGSAAGNIRFKDDYLRGLGSFEYIDGMIEFQFAQFNRKISGIPRGGREQEYCFAPNGAVQGNLQFTVGKRENRKLAGVVKTLGKQEVLGIRLERLDHLFGV